MNGVSYTPYAIFKDKMYVTPEMFGAIGDGVHDDTEAIQAAIDSGCNIIFLEPNKIYHLSKADNSYLYPNGDEPCLYIDSKTNIVFDGNGSILKVDEHAQGILEITRSSNIEIRNTHFKGCGIFPPMNQTTGRAEKGDRTSGYYNGAYDPEGHKNNEFDTSNLAGSLINGVAQPWGTFQGGYIYNVGSGILIENGCSHILVENVESEGFNYSGLSVGYRGHLDYPDSTDIKIIRCVIHDNYDDGVNLLKCDGVSIKDCTIYAIGHPDAVPEDEYTVSNYTYYDPGYGVTCRGSVQGSARPRNIIVENNHISRCVRKGVDSHSVEGLIVRSNNILNCLVSGIQLTTGRFERLASYDVIIDSNKLKFCGLKGCALDKHITTYDSAQPESPWTPDLLVENTVISNNILDQCSTNLSGIIYVRTGQRTMITGNIISLLHPQTPTIKVVVGLGHNDANRKYTSNASGISFINNTVWIPKEYYAFNQSDPSGSGEYELVTTNYYVSEYVLMGYRLVNSVIANNTIDVDKCYNLCVVGVGNSYESNPIFRNNAIQVNEYTNGCVVSSYGDGSVQGNQITGFRRDFFQEDVNLTFTNGFAEYRNINLRPDCIVQVEKGYDNSEWNYIYKVNYSTGSSVSDKHITIYARNADDKSSIADGDYKMRITIINYRGL